jgi:hypothetical protein
MKEKVKKMTRTPGYKGNLYAELQAVDSSYKTLAESLGYAKNIVSQRLNPEDVNFIMDTAGPLLVLLMVGFFELPEAQNNKYLERLKDSPNRELPLSDLWIQDPMWGSEKVAISKLFFPKIGSDRVTEFLTSTCEANLSIASF